MEQSPQSPAVCLAHVLVIDDVPAILDLLREIFEENGYRVTTSLERLNPSQLRAVSPDAIVLESRIAGTPALNEQDLAIVRDDPALAHVPIIFCTTCTEAVRNEALARQLGQRHVRVVHKPFDIDELLTILAGELAAVRGAPDGDVANCTVLPTPHPSRDCEAGSAADGYGEGSPRAGSAEVVMTPEGFSSALGLADRFSLARHPPRVRCLVGARQFTVNKTLPAAWFRNHLADAAFLTDPVSGVRGLVLVLLLVMTFADAQMTRLNIPAWTVIAGYACFAAVMTRLTRHIDHVGTWVQPFSELVVAGLLYLTAGSGSLPLFSLLLIALMSAVSLSSGWALGAIVAVAMITILGELLHQPASATQVLWDLLYRFIALTLVALAAAMVVFSFHRWNLLAIRADLRAEYLVERDRLRGRFVAAISHDLQTPLTAISAGLGLLEMSAGVRLNDDEKRLLHTARRNSDRMKMQINDLLVYNQIEAQLFTIHPTACDLRIVFLDVISLVHPLLTQKDQTLLADLPQRLVVPADRRYLEQALLNLVMNAHRHSPAESVIAIVTEAEGDAVAIRVRDSGPGIPAAVLPHIFEPFVQANASTEGSGLGLTIVKAIATAHGGTISVASQPGEGTTFTLELPIRDQGDQELEDSDATVPTYRR